MKKSSFQFRYFGPLPCMLSSFQSTVSSTFHRRHFKIFLFSLKLTNFLQNNPQISPNSQQRNLIRSLEMCAVYLYDDNHIIALMRANTKHKNSPNLCHVHVNMLSSKKRLSECELFIIFRAVRVDDNKEIKFVISWEMKYRWVFRGEINCDFSPEDEKLNIN